MAKTTPKINRAELKRLEEVIPEGQRLNELRAAIKDLRTELSAMPEKREQIRTNDMADLVAGLGDQFSGVYGAQQYSNQPRMQPYTLSGSSNFAQITLDRVMLTAAYTSQQLVALLCDLVVDDAMSGKIEFETDDELDPKELRRLQQELYAPRLGIRGGTTNIMQEEIEGVRKPLITDTGPSHAECIKFCRKMTRLFGGGGLIINTDQDYREPFDIEKIRPDSPLEFIPCDRWEISLMSTNLFGYDKTPFNYYGVPVNRTRCMIFKGKEAPSLVRQRLQGYGLSVLEPCIGAINAFMRFENLMFELLGQAKIDVYKINGFTALLGTPSGTAQAQQRIMMANAMKSFTDAVMIDKNDDYEQKKMTFAGMAEIWNELRRNLAAYLCIPMTKLFGESAGGFSSGADSLQNWNATVEIERTQIEPAILLVGKLLSKSIFGYVPETLRVKWTSLRSLDGVQEQQVLTAIQTRAVELFNNQALTGEEMMKWLQQKGVFTMDTAVGRGEVDIVAPAVRAEDTAEKSAMAKSAPGTGKDSRDKERSVKKDGRSA